MNGEERLDIGKRDEAAAMLALISRHTVQEQRDALSFLHGVQVGQALGRTMGGGYANGPPGVDRPAQAQ